jgi:hypothetical protein
MIHLHLLLIYDLTVMVILLSKVSDIFVDMHFEPGA